VWPDAVFFIGDVYVEPFLPAWQQRLEDLSWLSNANDEGAAAVPFGEEDPVMVQGDWEILLGNVREGLYEELIETVRTDPTALRGKVSYRVVRAPCDLDDALAAARILGTRRSILFLDFELGPRAENDSSGLYPYTEQLFARLSQDDALVRAHTAASANLIRFKTQLGGALAMFMYDARQGQLGPLKLLAPATRLNTSWFGTLKLNLPNTQTLYLDSGSSLGLIYPALEAWRVLASKEADSYDTRFWPPGTVDWFAVGISRNDGTQLLSEAEERVAEEERPVRLHSFPTSSSPRATITMALDSYLGSILYQDDPFALSRTGPTGPAGTQTLFYVLKGLVGAGSAVQGNGAHPPTVQVAALVILHALSRKDALHALDLYRRIDWPEPQNCSSLFASQQWLAFGAVGTRAKVTKVLTGALIAFANTVGVLDHATDRQGSICMTRIVVSLTSVALTVDWGPDTFGKTHGERFLEALRTRQGSAGATAYLQLVRALEPGASPMSDAHGLSDRVTVSVAGPLVTFSISAASLSGQRSHLSTPASGE
jgi:hypothetical protein